jgi:hypothetical protein
MPRYEPPDEEDDRPKLQNLAQAARGNQLKQIRGTLVGIGILTILLNAGTMFLIPGDVRAGIAKAGQAPNAPGMAQAETIGLIIGFTLNGSLVLLGLVFLVLAALVRRFPVPILITALVLFTIPTLTCGVLNLIGGGGLVWITVANIFCIIALAKAIPTAIAYQREQNAELLAAEGKLSDEDTDD